MLDAFTVFRAPIRIASTSACREYLPPDCRQETMASRWFHGRSATAAIGFTHRYPSLRDTAILTVSSERRVPTKAIWTALSQAPDSLVEAAANRVRFTRSREFAYFGFLDNIDERKYQIATRAVVQIPNSHERPRY
ncbi:hypothetical protein ACOME3_009004 [Neoechinorhynchus agilis]